MTKNNDEGTYWGDFSEAMRAKMRGASDYWYWRNKPEMEVGAAQEVLSRAGLSVERLRARRDGNDPPDCEAEIGGQHCGIEVTELLHRKTLEATIRGTAQYFLWDREDLLRELQGVIDRKDRPHTVKGGPYDRYILVIVTDEFVLGQADTKGYLSGAVFRSHMITDVYLGLSYDPAFEGGSCPVFELTLSRR